MLVLDPYLDLKEQTQHGCKIGHQPAEIVLLLRVLVEGFLERSIPLILMKINILSAHDLISPVSVYNFMLSGEVPIRLAP